MRRAAVCVFVLLCVSSPALGAVTSADTSRAAFDAFVVKHRKSYATDGAREAAYARFVASAEEAVAMRRRNPHATFGVTARSDMDRRSGLQPRRGGTSKAAANSADGGTPLRAPESLDWRTSGAVQPVPNLGECGGACVTFTYTGIGSAIDKIRGYDAALTELSSQQMIDCEPTTTTCGCDSGCALHAPYEALMTNGGLWDTAASYPFTGADGTCGDRNASAVVGARVTEFVPVEKHNPSALTAAVMKSPVGATLFADMWQTYTSGVLTDCGTGQPDTAALVVGYNDAPPVPYWIVQNNWGTEWGMQGYIYIAKGNNTCGILDEPFVLGMAPV